MRIKINKPFADLFTNTRIETLIASSLMHPVSDDNPSVGDTRPGTGWLKWADAVVCKTDQDKN